MTTDIARQWEAALAALDQDHEARLAWVAQAGLTAAALRGGPQ